MNDRQPYKLITACVGQNKNKAMIWYLAWRIICNLHDRIELNFMLPGHTKFRPDSFFGLFKKHYRHQHTVDDMGDLARCVRECTRNVNCIPQLFKDWNYYDWNSFFEQWFLPCTGIASYHTFIFSRQHPSVVKVKKSPTDDVIEVQLFKNGITMVDLLKVLETNCMPSILYPKGLTNERMQYLYDNIREFVHDKSKADNVCPKPVGSVSPPQHECSEDEGKEKRRRKRRRTKSEFTYSFACTMCDKKYNSNSALYSHKKKYHAQAAVLPTKEGQPVQSEKAQPSDQDVSQALASGNHHVDGITKPGKRKRRKKSELTLSFACTMCDKKYDTSSALHTHQRKNK